MCGSRRRSGGGKGRARNMAIIAQQQAEANRRDAERRAMEQERQAYQNMINSVTRTPPPPPVAPAPVQPRSNIDYGESVSTFQPGKKKKKDRGQQSRGTGSLRIPRTGVNASAGGGGSINV